MPEYISLQQASKYTGYSHDYLRLRARQGKLEAVKIGRNWVTTKQWLDEYVSKVDEYNGVKHKVDKSLPLQTITLPIQPRPRSRAIAVWVLAIVLITGTVFAYPYFGDITKSLTNTVNNLAMNLKSNIEELSDLSLDIETEFLNEAKQDLVSNISSLFSNLISLPKDKIEQLSKTNVDLYTKILKTRNLIINTSKSVYSALSDTYQFVIRPWKQQPIVIDTDLRDDLEQLKQQGITTKEVIKELTQVTQILPVTEITKEYVKVDNLELKKVKQTIADIAKYL